MIILPSRNGMLLRNSNGIISSDCGGPVAFTCPCELLTGTNCSCYGTNPTPSTYIADFGEMGKFCLNYVSGCTWQKSVGTITVTLNLTYATNTTRLTVVDGSTTVFSGDLVATSCDGRKYGIISNTVSPSDWTSVTIAPGCSDYSCLDGRFITLSLTMTSNTPYVLDLNPPTSNVSKIHSLSAFETVNGFLGLSGTICYIQNQQQDAAYWATYDRSCVILGGARWQASSLILALYPAGNVTMAANTQYQNFLRYNTTLSELASFAVGESRTYEAVLALDKWSTICGGTGDPAGYFTLTIY